MTTVPTEPRSAEPDAPAQASSLESSTLRRVITLLGGLALVAWSIWALWVYLSGGERVSPALLVVPIALFVVGPWLLYAVYLQSLRSVGMRERLRFLDRFLIGCGCVWGIHALIGWLGTDSPSWALGFGQVAATGVAAAGIATVIGIDRRPDPRALDLVRRPMVLVAAIALTVGVVLATTAGSFNGDLSGAGDNVVPVLVTDDGRVVLGELVAGVSSSDELVTANVGAASGFMDEGSVRLNAPGRSDIQYSSGPDATSVGNDMLRARLRADGADLDLSFVAADSARSWLPGAVDVYAGRCGALSRAQLSNGVPVRAGVARLDVALDDLRIDRPLSIQFEHAGGANVICLDLFHKHAVLLAQAGAQRFQADCVDTLSVRDDERTTLQPSSFESRSCRDRANRLIQIDGAVILQGETVQASQRSANEFVQCIRTHDGVAGDPMQSGNVLVIPIAYDSYKLINASNGMPTCSLDEMADGAAWAGAGASGGFTGPTSSQSL